MLLSRNEITAIINTVWDAVCQSRTGPIVKEDETGQLQIQTIAYNTFLSIVSKVMPVDMQATATMTDESGKKCEAQFNQKEGNRS